MPTPNPTPTAEQLIIVGEITMLSVDQVREMISQDAQDIADAKWTRTLTDIENWDEIRLESGDIKRVGNIEFFEGKNVSSRLDFRNMIRARYGYSGLVTENQQAISNIISTLKYF